MANNNEVLVPVPKVNGAAEAECSNGGDLPETNAHVPLEAESSSGGGDVQATGSGLQESVDSCPDIMPGLVRACKDMGNRELILGDNFNDASVMLVVQETDQKLSPNLALTNYSVDEAIKNDGAPVPLSSDRTLCIQRVIDVMDHLLACEATWHHEIKALEQTVYSCYYIRRPERLSSYPLLHSFCMVTVLTCNAVTLAMDSSDKVDDTRNAYYNSSTSYGDKYLSMLETAENNIVCQLKACQAPPSKKKNKKSRGGKTLQTNPDLEEGFCKAVLCRMRFRKYFYRLVTCMRSPRGTGMDLAKELITACLAELKSIQDYFESSSSSIENRMEHRTTASGRQPVGFGSPVNFTNLDWTAISRQFSALTRARAIKLLSWEKTVDYFRRLLQDLNMICSTPQCTDLDGVIRFMLDYHKRQPGCVALAHIQLYLVQNERLYGCQHMFAVICKAALLPESVIHDDIWNYKEVQLLGKLLSNFIKGLCLRISKQREFFAQSIVDWWTTVEKLYCTFRDEFGDLSVIPTDKNMSSVKICRHILEWVVEQRHWMALQFLLLGFDLELYSNSEYFMIYWCMRIIMLELVDTKREQMQLKNSSEALYGSDGWEISLIDCYISLTTAFDAMFVVFRKAGKVPLCMGPFNDEEQRFIQLFKPLIAAGYSLHYDVETEEGIDISAVQGFFLRSIDVAISQRDSVSEGYGVEEADQIEYIAIRNYVALGIFSRIHEDPGLKISFNFSYHRYFPVVELTRSQNM